MSRRAPEAKEVAMQPTTKRRILWTASGLVLAVLVIVAAIRHHATTEPTTDAAASPTGATGPAETGSLYHCPMHPTMVSDRPGDCKICGMRLVPIKDESAEDTATPAPPMPTG